MVGKISLEKLELDNTSSNNRMFSSARLKSLTRVGVIDIGSNSVRMVVFDGAARSPAYFFNENICFLISEGKGLGCVATVDIEKGSLILTENPQICGDTEEEEESPKWIKSLMKNFNRMKKADQLEYMELHSKYNNFQDFKNSPDAKDIEMFKEEVVEKNIKNWKLEINKIEKNPNQFYFTFVHIVKCK